MIRNCKNCAGSLRYDTRIEKLVCGRCGSTFGVEEFDAPEDESNLPFIELDETFECKIYECQTCGANISVTDTEASTFCIYCGNPTVIFSKIGKLKKPDCIIPFKITKDEALYYARTYLGDSFLIPEEIRNLKAGNIRGIYVPYYITSVECDGSAIFEVVEKKNSKNSQYNYYKLSGFVNLPNVTTDACKRLNDHLSQRLEPFDIKKAVPFDEDYLVGFYSDVADIDRRSGILDAKKRAEDVFMEELGTHLTHNKTKIIKKRFDAEVYEEPMTAMFPAWFLTYKYQGKPYTIIINGQTGKTVGGIPWNRKRFYTLFAILAVSISVLSAILLRVFLVPGLSNGSFELIYYIAAGAVVSLIAGAKKMSSVSKAVKRASESTLISYITKRHEGD